MRAVHLLKRAGKEFVRNLALLLGAFGALGVILVVATHLPLLGVLGFVGIFASVTATISTVVVLWSGADDEAPLSANRGMSLENAHSKGGAYYPGFLDSGGWGDGGGGGC